jgi:hypothetical protein
MSKTIKKMFKRRSLEGYRLEKTYDFCCFDHVLGGGDHVVSQETESKVVVRSGDAIEGRNDGDSEKEVFEDFRAVHGLNLNYNC